MPEKYTCHDITRVRQLRPFRIDYRRVRSLEYRSRNGRGPQTFAEYATQYHFHGMLVTEKQPRPQFPEGLSYLQMYDQYRFEKGKLLVLVNYDLYPQIEAALNQYIQDLAYEGYWAETYRVKGGTPAQLRNFLHGQNPAGALLVGSLPVAWFEVESGSSTVEFPCDLFYMDLNGTWFDPDHDGKFSGHLIGTAPEIWVGRLWTPTQGGNDAVLLNDYFARNHQFRTGQLGFSDRALAFVDNEFNFGNCALDEMFPAANISVTPAAQTSGARLLADINQQLAWAHIVAHGSATCHELHQPVDLVENGDISSDSAPDGFFYNLCSCCNADYTTEYYMAGAYLFGNPNRSRANGMAVVGLTNVGGMAYWENFYGAMAGGKTIGEALVAWWKCLMTPLSSSDQQNFYGITLLGDPTLNWWHGAVPQLVSPYAGDWFNHNPQMTRFCWRRVDLPDARYQLQVDSFDYPVAGAWAYPNGRHFQTTDHVSENFFAQTLYNVTRYRWRVRARSGQLLSPWSGWQSFEYTLPPGVAAPHSA